ncbi:MAG: hypothetical protein WBU92_07995 [Candidatus Dormiibacterota bacterium]
MTTVPCGLTVSTGSLGWVGAGRVVGRDVMGVFVDGVGLSRTKAGRRVELTTKLGPMVRPITAAAASASATAAVARSPKSWAKIVRYIVWMGPPHIQADLRR